MNKDLLLSWQRPGNNGHPLGGKGSLLSLALLLAALIAGFWPAFEKLSIRWASGDNSYCYLIVPLFLYLCWDKRKEFRFHELSWSLWGLPPVLAGVALLAIGELGSMETLMYLGIWLTGLGLFTLAYGCRIRRLAFPFLILLFLVPLPPYLNRLLTFKLKMQASSLAVLMMRLLGVTVLQEGNIIDLGVRQLQVVDACSGLRYLMPLFLIALLIGHFTNLRRTRRLVLTALVFPLAVLVNGLRIMITGVLSVHGHPELAENFFHDFAGLVIFLVASVLLGLTALTLRGERPRRSNRSRSLDPGGRPTPLPTVILLVFLFASLFLGTGWALHRFPAMQTSPERLSFEGFPLKINGWQGQRDFLSRAILDELWADDYLKATFTNPDRPGQFIYLFIPYYRYQGTRHTAHAPQSCLLGGGWALIGSQDKVVHLADGRKIPLRLMLLEKDGQRLLSGYFFLSRGRVITSPWRNKFFLLWDALTRRRTDGALIRVEMVLPPGRSLAVGDRDLQGFIAQLWNLLPAYIPA